MRKLAALVVAALCASLVVSVPGPAGAGTFDDVPAGIWFEDAVEWLASSGVTTGTTDTTFSPNDLVTRAQMAAFLARFANATGNSPASTFDDVQRGAWYAGSVDFLLERAITSGTSATLYSPDDFVTRAQMVTFLWRMAGRAPSTTALPFTDVPEGTWFTDAVRWVWDEQVTTGTSDTTFSPDGFVTRAQMAAFLHRLAGEPPVGFPGVNRSASMPIPTGGGTISDGGVTVAIGGLSGAGHVKVVVGQTGTADAGSAVSKAVQIIVSQATFSGGITITMPIDALDLTTFDVVPFVWTPSGVWQQLGGTGTTSVINGTQHVTFTIPASAALAVTSADAGQPLSVLSQSRIVVQAVKSSKAASDRGDIVMARANWSTGYFQAAIFKALLEELGYQVNEPANLELPPSNFFTALGEGEIDFWANSWYPGHFSWWNNELSDGSVAGDHVSVVGELLMAGGLQGFLTNASIAADNPGLTLDEIDATPQLVSLYDASDSLPSDGKVQILGCPEAWTCDEIIDEMIAFAGWSNIEQVKVGYGAMIDEAVSLAADDLPFIAYTWTPSSYITRLVPGENAVWLAVEASSVLDGSITPEFNQRFDGVPIPASMGTDLCSADPCHLGWLPHDIQVTANTDFLVAKPIAAELLEQVTIPFIDVARQNVLYDGGESTTADVNRHAADWIAANRSVVDVWLAAARAAE